MSGSERAHHEGRTSVDPTEAESRSKAPAECLAHWVSQVFSPPVMGMLALGVVLASIEEPSGWQWAGLYLLIAMVPPAAFLAWQVHRGRVTDLDVQVREQRHPSQLVAVAASALAWAILRIGQAPMILQLVAIAATLQWFLIYVITLRWKISVHSAAATAVTWLLLWCLGGVATPMAVVPPFVAWSRVRLRRHTPAQTVAGIALGSTVFFVALLIALWM